ncbi:hypothetical protein HDE_12748 [Halotydeus destructor]|nr:hypothetical protein HDE_12748 [Halotydeus destructor]
MNISVETYHTISVKVRLGSAKTFYQEVSASVSSPKALSILDVGCCLGDVTVMIPEYFNVSKLVAVDLDETMVEYARTNFPEIDFRVADCSVPWFDFQKIGIEPNSVDMVLSSYTIHWFYSNEQRSNFLGTVSQVLTEDGQGHFQLIPDYKADFEIFKEYLEASGRKYNFKLDHETLKSIEFHKKFWTDCCEENGLTVIDIKIIPTTQTIDVAFLVADFRLYLRRLLGYKPEDEDDIADDFLAYFHRRLKRETVIKGDGYELDRDLLTTIYNDFELHVKKA